MKQQLTKRHQFASKGQVQQWEAFHQTELRVQRLERIIEDLLFWVEGTAYYNQAKEEYINDYCEVNKHD